MQGGLSVCPRRPETARALRRLGPPFAPDDAARRDAALELLESLDFARPTVLVVDDVHLLASAPSCVRFFQILARQAMSNLHIVLTTRHFQTDDALLSDLKGELARLGPALLAFSEEEHPGILRPVRPQGRHGPRSAPCMGPRADGSAAYICIAAITRNTGLFPCPPSPVLSARAPSPQSSPPYLSPQYSENELPPDMAALLEEQLSSPTLPGRAGHAFRTLPAGAVRPAAGGFLLRHGYWAAL